MKKTKNATILRLLELHANVERGKVNCHPPDEAVTISNDRWRLNAHF